MITVTTRLFGIATTILADEMWDIDYRCDHHFAPDEVVRLARISHQCLEKGCC